MIVHKLPVKVSNMLCRYGLTETAATCAKTWPDDPTGSGTVGPPGPCNEIKLIDVPAMGYTSEDQPNPRGELCLRGANCFSVYHKGIVLENRYLRIIS